MSPAGLSYMEPPLSRMQQGQGYGEAGGKEAACEYRGGSKGLGGEKGSLKIYFIAKQSLKETLPLYDSLVPCVHGSV